MQSGLYDGAVEEWMVRLAFAIAKRLGLRGAQREDALQQLMWELACFRFDPAKANGASEQSTVAGLIERRLIQFRRAQLRHSRRYQPWPEVEPASPNGHDPDLALDVKEALKSFTPQEREICRWLAAGCSVQEIAARLDMNWHAVRRAILRLREQFAARGVVLGA